MLKRLCYIAGCWAALTMCLHACRSHKTVTSTAETDFYASCYPIESITVSKCKLNITENNKSYRLNADLYIDPDSVCYFRGTLMVEIIRGVIYRDSFAIINRPERICYKGKTEFLSNFAGVTVTPESLFLLFTADKCEKVYRENFSYKLTDKGNMIFLREKSGSSLQMFLNETDQTIEKIAAHNPRLKDTKFNITYGQYQRYGQFILPSFFDIFAGTDRNFLRFEIDFQDIWLNRPHNINFAVPSGYKTIILQ